jgi:hypothetical protein
MFARETNLALPEDAARPKLQQFKRAKFIENEHRDEWIQWRCKKITELHARISDRVRQARPDLTVYVDNFDIGIEGGVDEKQLAALDGVVMINSRHTYGRRLPGDGDQAQRDHLTDPEVLHSMYSPTGAVAFMAGSGYFEATAQVVPPALLGYPASTKQWSWISGVCNPSGRFCLERYALYLAECDANFLGDGGNAYTVNQPLLREFMAEYRNLPNRRFTPRADSRDPVAVWESKDNDAFYFYAVNREQFPIGVEIQLNAASVVQLGNNKEYKIEHGVLKLELSSCQLLAFRAPANAAISWVTLSVPTEARDRAEKLVAWLDGVATAAKASDKLDDKAKTLIEKLSKEAKTELQAGHLWRARIIPENAGLLAVYRTLGQEPPPELFAGMK